MQDLEDSFKISFLNYFFLKDDLILINAHFFFTGNTTNLQFHLDSQHKLKAPEEKSTQPKIDQFNKDAKESSERFVSPRLSKTKQDQIDDALLKLMIGKVLPFSLVENEKFKEFVRLLEPRYVHLTDDSVFGV